MKREVSTLHLFAIQFYLKGIFMLPAVDPWGITVVLLSRTSLYCIIFMAAESLSKRQSILQDHKEIIYAFTISFSLPEK